MPAVALLPGRRLPELADLDDPILGIPLTDPVITADGYTADLATVLLLYIDQCQRAGPDTPPKYRSPFTREDLPPAVRRHRTLAQAQIAALGDPRQNQSARAVETTLHAPGNIDLGALVKSLPDPSPDGLAAVLADMREALDAPADGESGSFAALGAFIRVICGQPGAHLGWASDAALDAGARALTRVVERVRANGMELGRMPAHLRANPRLALAAVQQNPIAYGYTLGASQSDPEVALAALAGNPLFASPFLPPSLTANRDFWLRALEVAPRVASEVLRRREIHRADKALAIEVVRRCQESLALVDGSIRREVEEDLARPRTAVVRG